MNSISTLHWTSLVAVFTPGQLREWTQSRAEVIMSAVGATDWYKDQLSEHNCVPVEDNIVLGPYSVSFLQAAAHRLGPTFFTATPSDLRFAQGAVVNQWSQTWTGHDDASAHLQQAGVLTAKHLSTNSTHEYNPIKGDILWAPTPLEDGTMTIEREIDAFFSDLKAWLDEFSNPRHGAPGLQSGLLTKQVGCVERHGQKIILKIGVYLANYAPSWDV